MMHDKQAYEEMSISELQTKITMLQGDIAFIEAILKTQIEKLIVKAGIKPVDWGKAPKWANYIAWNKDGYAFWYKSKPYIKEGNDGFSCSGKPPAIDYQLAMYYFTDKDQPEWKDLLFSKYSKN